MWLAPGAQVCWQGRRGERDGRDLASGGEEIDEFALLWHFRFFVLAPLLCLRICLMDRALALDQLLVVLNHFLHLLIRHGLLLQGHGLVLLLRLDWALRGDHLRLRRLRKRLRALLHVHFRRHDLSRSLRHLGLLWRHLLLLLLLWLLEAIHLLSRRRLHSL